MNIQTRKINELHAYTRNPRKNEAAVTAVANSISQFGFLQPIVIDSNNEIVAGHTRYFACEKLGLATIPCVVADELSPEQLKAYRLADNKTGELAEWDYNLLDAELAELVGVDMSAFGFDISAINPEDYGQNFSLPAGDKNEIVVITFTLHQKQADLITDAMDTVKDEIKETFGNGNKHGNELYEVVRQWAELRK